ncbi:hypothetical protein MSG28_000884 [Choristoneura fumiferana]|uniref:Uncharacterized protein n=1 Tax=Choristoneura fumiferana TaxID=7141 RepID=A0ACC0K2U9_CHOFU|nr:hypothetical protein MSG28_000884 [Choristoneura fumiferana]
MDSEAATTTCDVKVKKQGRKNEKKKKTESKQSDKSLDEVCRQMSKLADEESASGSSTDSDDLVNAINYNTITSLAALKDIIQGDSNDTPETDSFFQHYFMNHCNNLSSLNPNSNSPFPYSERRRLSQCREEDEDDEKKDNDLPLLAWPLDVCPEAACEGSSKSSKEHDSSDSVEESKKKINADNLPPKRKTASGTTGVSRRPALFDIFKTRPRGETKKQPSIMKQVKAAVQSMTKTGVPYKDATGKPEEDKPEVKAESEASTPSTPGAPTVKARDGSAHRHPGSDSRLLYQN